MKRFFENPPRKRVLAAALLGLCAFTLYVLVGCTTPSAQGQKQSASAAPEASAGLKPPKDTPERAPQPPEQKAAAIIKDMTLEQKVAQLFFITPEALTGVGTATAAGQVTKDALAAHPVGGIVYFQKNLIGAEQTEALLSNSTAYSQSLVGLPLFTGVDEEGGTVSRIGGNPGFDIPNVGNMSAVGATGDPDKAKAVAQTVGTYLKKLGFTVNFAPDADIANNPQSNTMLYRSFGSDPQLVSSMVSAQVQGYKETGILPAAKHFPGIGGAVGDSHNDTIVSEKTLADIRGVELAPFAAAIKEGVPFIMVGHLSLPAITGTDMPASLSSEIMVDLLRTEMGYEGIIITDSLSMGAIERYHTPDQVGVAALQAGSDMLLMPSDFNAAYQGVLDAVGQNTLTEKRIDESLTRIVVAKLALE